LESSAEGEECVIAGDGQYWLPSRKSVFQKSTLVQFASSSSYPNPVALGRHTLGEAASDMIDFESVGREKTKMPMIKIEAHLHYLQRYFADKPKIANDFLTKQYMSVPRVIK